MDNRFKKPIGDILKSTGKRRENRSPFTAKSVLLASGVFLGALGVSTIGTEKGAHASWLQSLAPGILTIAGSYLAGFFIGWGARRAIKLTSIIAGSLVAATAALVWLGWDLSGVHSWLNSTSAWADENIEGAGRYLLSLLPSASSAGVGGVLGFRRK